MTGVRYSPYPPDSYSVSWEGGRFGLGRYPPLKESLAAWNLFWLAYPPVDELLTWPPERAQDVPIHCPLVDVCVTIGGGPAGQILVCPKPLVAVDLLVSNWMEWCTGLSPQSRYIPIMRGRAGEAEQRLALPDSPNVIVAQFTRDSPGRAEVTQPGNSNIIPLRRK